MVSREEHLSRVREQKLEAQAYREKLGRACAAIMDFMRLENRVLVDAGIFTQPEHVAMFKKGRAYIIDEKIAQLPVSLNKAYQERTGEKFIPEVVRFGGLNQMIEKGERLARLDRNALRAGLLYHIQATPEKGGGKKRCQNAGYGDSLFHSFIHKEKTTLASVEQMRTIIGGGDDLFDLEKLGKDVFEYMAAKKRISVGNYIMVMDPLMEAVVEKCLNYNITGPQTALAAPGKA